MNQRTLRIPGTLKHTSDEQTDVAVQEKAREHVDRLDWDLTEIGVVA